MLFLLPATALWSLLPLVARQQLAWGAEGYGLLVASIGVGAVVAARVLHALHRRLLMDRTLAVSMLGFAVGLFMLSHSEGGTWGHDAVALFASFLMGAAWMICLTTLNATAQMTLANHLRARGMGAYMTTMALAMALGALIWGQVASLLGLAWTQWIAAAALVVTAGCSFLFPVDREFDQPESEASTGE
jgi:predicted MFS family arabinose efflux permease